MMYFKQHAKSVKINITVSFASLDMNYLIKQPKYFYINPHSKKIKKKRKKHLII